MCTGTSTGRAGIFDRQGGGRSPGDGALQGSPATGSDAVENTKGGGGIRRSASRRGGETRVAPGEDVAGNAPTAHTAHALCADGLEAIDVASVRKALSDRNADVRASAVRLSERWLASDQSLKSAVVALADDKNWNVRRQVAASLGEMSSPDRLAPATAILARDGARSHHRRCRSQ